MALIGQYKREISFSDHESDDEYGNLFDQYMSSDVLGMDDHLIEPTIFVPEHTALPVRLTGGGAAGPSRALEANAIDLQPWHIGPWGQVTALSPPVNLRGGEFTFYRESSGRAAISDSELLSLESRQMINPFIPPQSPQTPSPSFSAPSSTPRTKGVTSTSKSKRTRKARRTSPTMMQSNYHRDPSQPWHNPQNPSSVKLGLQVPPRTMPLSPPPSAVRQIFTERGTAENVYNHNGHAVLSNGLQVQGPPLSSPVEIQHARRTDMAPRSISNNYTIPTTYSQGSALTQDAWSDKHDPSGPLQYAFSASPAYPTSQQQPWTYQAAQQTPVSQPCQSGYHILRLDPQQQQAAKNLMHYPRQARTYDSSMLDGSASMASAELMIQDANPPSPEDHLMTGIVNDNSSNFYPASVDNSMLQGQILNPDISDGRSFERLSASQPHISIAPTTPPSRSVSRSPDGQGHSRRASKTSSGSSRVRKQSNGQSSSAQPRTPSNSSTDMVFHNYTPGDSRKILSGVAPSGSSKTKARREKEAQEKRRKLSEAAIAAVVAAGGDPEQLVRDGVLMET